MDDKVVDDKQAPDRTNEGDPIPTAVPADAPNVPLCPKCGGNDWWAMVNYGPGEERFFLDLEKGGWHREERNFEIADTTYVCGGCWASCDDDDVWAALEEMPWA